jgi:hypothetical protein
MADVKASLRADVTSAFEELTTTAKSLNVASDALGKFVAEIEDALKSLGLGVASWVQIECGENEDKSISWHRDVGYDKLGKNWCICLRSIRQHNFADDLYECETWAFNEGPRWLRINAVDHLPALLKKLSDDGKNMTKHVTAKLETVADIKFGIDAVLANKNSLAGAKKR